MTFWNYKFLKLKKKKRMDIQIEEPKNVGLMGIGYRKNGDPDHVFLKSDLFPSCAYKEPLTM